MSEDEALTGKVSRPPEPRQPELPTSRCNEGCSSRWRKIRGGYVAAVVITGAALLMVAAEYRFRRLGYQQNMDSDRRSEQTVGEPLERRPSEGADGNALPVVEGDSEASPEAQAEARVHFDLDLEEGDQWQEGEEAGEGDVGNVGDYENEGDSSRGGDQDTIILPQCYSSPSADPSRGVWKECENGEDESPADMVHWNYSLEHQGPYQRCSQTWAKLHPHKGPAPYYEWEAEDCVLQKVDAAKFCRVMEGRKGLLFVGDSLTGLMTTTLASILRAENTNSTVTGPARGCHDEWLACDGVLKVTFQRNDFLDTGRDQDIAFKYQRCELPDHSDTRCTVFADDDTLRGFDTLVVNSGAHPRSLDTYGPAMEAASKELAASMKRLHGEDNVILVVRNTVPGHWGCTERRFDGPVDIEVAVDLVVHSPKEYKWTSFYDCNTLLKQAFLGDPDRGWRWLDAYTPTLLRADSHFGGADCLHYCLPGPADHWVRLLYNILVVATSSREGGGTCC